MNYGLVDRKREQCGSERDQQGPRRDGGGTETNLCPKQSLEDAQEPRGSINLNPKS